MARYHLNYKVSIENTTLQHLKVSLTISSIAPYPLDFYKGKLRLTSFVCNAPYHEASDRYSITPTDTTLSLTYTVAVGYEGKHGVQGCLTKDFLCFSGDQVFLFPVDLLAAQNLTPSPTIGDVHIHLDCPNVSTFILPGMHSDETTSATYCQAPAWHHSYALMKSPYVAGHLKCHRTSRYAEMLKIYTPSSVQALDPSTLDNIENLYHFYAQLFDTTAHPLTLVLLDPVPQRLGGCGTHAICMSFDAKNPRDWQLLAHRMFHSFMDAQFPLSDFHMPPQLWLTEGLATYYENIALDSLSDTLKTALDLNSSDEFCKLFTRYLYSKLKPYSLFNFPPMTEKSIRSLGLLEFLHYTHAPLIMKYIQDHYGSTPNDLITHLKTSMIHHTFSMETFFTTLLGNDVDHFAHDYLFGTRILPLWTLQSPKILTIDALIEDLNYFEYLLYSWLVHERPDYVQITIPKALSAIPFSASETAIGYLGTVQSQALRSYSPTLYHLIHQLFNTY